MRISDWSSDVCSSDLPPFFLQPAPHCRAFASRSARCPGPSRRTPAISGHHTDPYPVGERLGIPAGNRKSLLAGTGKIPRQPSRRHGARRSEEHTSELQSLMRISSAVFCLKKKQTHLSNSTPSRHHTTNKQQK